MHSKSTGLKLTFIRPGLSIRPSDGCARDDNRGGSAVVAYRQAGPVEMGRGTFWLTSFN